MRILIGTIAVLLAVSAPSGFMALFQANRSTNLDTMCCRSPLRCLRCAGDLLPGLSWVQALVRYCRDRLQDKRVSDGGMPV